MSDTQDPSNALSLPEGFIVYLHKTGKADKILEDPNLFLLVKEYQEWKNRVQS